MLKWPMPVLFLCSLALGLVLFFAFPNSPSGDFFPGAEGGYAALAFEEADGGTVLALERALGRPVLSEFSQWVLLDSLGGLEQVPLEAYEGRLEAFDPRRDAYAVKLRDFFRRGGKRWIFIALDRSLFGFLPVLNPEGFLTKKIDRALDAAGAAGSGRFSLILKPEARPPALRFLPFALAWPAALVLAGGLPRPGPAGGGRRARRRGPVPGRRLPPATGEEETRRALVLLAPPIFTLSLWGAAGCALLALYLYLAVLLTPPLREFWARAAGKFRPGPAPGPYRFNLRLSLALAPLFPLILLAGGLPPLPGLLGLAGLFALYFWYLGARTSRFVPLPILARRPGRPLPAAPFALASCLALLFGLRLPAGVPAPDSWPGRPTEQDYGDHLLYQSGFSQRPLRGRASSSFAGGAYFRYTVGEDGLVEGVLPGPPDLGAPDGGPGTEIPPFPLADLSDFLARWDSPRGLPWNSGGWPNLAPPLFSLALAALPLNREGKRRKIRVHDDKRIAA
jgi:hypothetical protein